MNYTLYGFLLASSLIFVMLILLEVGRRIGIRRLAQDPEGARFDARRHLMVELTKAIGTAYLRLDMLPSAAPPALPANFRRCIDARLDVYRKLPDLSAVNEAPAKGDKPINRLR